ncbi:TetR family transcriptional regulator [Actinocorallia herbida]|uniref:TetR family transcriptional regulator n=1 Tax=Actinocorallia herbida TaxID=58109 RepID=A0A3N1CUP8_9ACTN|nr:TetR/AcrR family transcriptional regulator [Actinocorallia herbida]ROO85026.1 TetR family transcriptional regulator [Actinocorallia herbida]
MDDAERDRVVEAATRLFAELGYDQTDSTLIAETAGVSAADVRREFGGRRELYIEVFRRLQAAEWLLLRAYTEGGVDREGAHRFIDAYIDFSLEHREHAALWTQRRMNDAADLREVETEFVVPQTAASLEAFAALFDDGVDPELMIWSVTWIVQAFTLAGLPGTAERVGPRSVARFRAHLHSLVDRALR